MNKETFYKIYLFMLGFVVCSYFSGVAFAGICDECNNSGGVPTFTGNFNVPQGWRAIKWAPNNPEEIDRNKTLAVKVINGTYPYFWSVNGTGFSLDPVQTQAAGPSNTLTADDTACGAAEITVIDNDGKPETFAIGYIRSTTGSAWVYKYNSVCTISGGSFVPSGSSGGTSKVQGKGKQVQSVFKVQENSSYNCNLQRVRYCPGSYPEPCLAEPTKYCSCWKEGGYWYMLYTHSLTYYEWECD